jgi:hypothetical protein
MQETSMKVINRKIDDDIYTELNTASTTWGGALVAAPGFVSTARTILANNFALDEEPYAIVTPAFVGQLMGYQQFTSSDFVNLKGFENVSKSRAFNWYGVNWIVDAGLPGTGTATADCFMHAKASIGHACDIENIRTEVGYDRKNDKSWARCSTFMGSKLLQDIGVVKMTHDDTAAFPVNTF